MYLKYFWKQVNKKKEKKEKLTYLAAWKPAMRPAPLLSLVGRSAAS
jgi:hypothetical protein